MGMWDINLPRPSLEQGWEIIIWLRQEWVGVPHPKPALLPSLILIFGIRYQNFDFVWSKIGCKFFMFHPTTPKLKWKSKFSTKIEVNTKWHQSLNPSVL